MGALAKMAGRAFVGSAIGGAVYGALKKWF